MVHRIWGYNSLCGGSKWRKKLDNRIETGVIWWLIFLWQGIRRLLPGDILQAFVCRYPYKEPPHRLGFIEGFVTFPLRLKHMANDLQRPALVCSADSDINPHCPQT